MADHGRFRGRLGAGMAFALVVASVAVPERAMAGAWTRAAGEAFAMGQVAAYYSDHAFGPSSELYASRSYDKVEATLTFEYGAADWLTLIAAPQFLSIRLGEPYPSSYDGPGYVDAGARARLFQGEGQGMGYVVSAQAVARAPGASGSQSAAAVGYTDWEADFRLLLGLSFELFGKPAFFNGEVAQRQRFGDPPDEFRLDLTLGARVAPRWQVLVQSFNVISEGAGEGPYFGVSYEYYKAQLGFAYDWDEKLTFLMSAVSTYYARNAPQENGGTLAAFYKF